LKVESVKVVEKLDLQNLPLAPLKEALQEALLNADLMEDVEGVEKRSRRFMILSMF
jgi:hypothetical protein